MRIKEIKSLVAKCETSAVEFKRARDGVLAGLLVHEGGGKGCKWIVKKAEVLK